MKLYGVTRSWDSDKCAQSFAKTHLYEFIIWDDTAVEVANIYAEGYENGWYDALDNQAR